MKHSIQRRDKVIDTEPALDFAETEFSSIVAAGGGRYVGVLKEFPNKIEPGILFNSPRTRTALDIPNSRLPVETVCEQLAECDAALAGAGAK